MRSMRMRGRGQGPSAVDLATFAALLLTPGCSYCGCRPCLAAAAQAEAQAQAPLFLSLYKPATNVDDVAAIDLDQRSVVARLALGSEEGMDEAKAVYSEGAYSQPYANLTLSFGALETEISKGTAVTGTTSDGAEVAGTAMHHANVGDTALTVQYDVGSDTDSPLCRVGGISNPDISGCFAPTGKIRINGLLGQYSEYTSTYSPLEDNYNGRTIQGLSTNMYQCDNCPTYSKFFDYYGASDYADRWIQAAFAGTSIAFRNGDVAFSKFDLEGRASAIRWGTVALNVWMYAVSRLEEAASNCETDCVVEGCNNDQVRSWDEAVAIYTGSESKHTGDGGYLLYTLANTECQRFGTCNNGGMAAVNSQIFAKFVKGKENLLEGRCVNARLNMKRITDLMAIPLVQGVLRSAYALDVNDDFQETTQGRGAAFSASILPILNHCSAPNAGLIYNDLTPGNGQSGSYEVIKAALERSYDCLGITCDDVGGLVDLYGEGYLKGAEACGSNVQPTRTSSKPSPTFDSESSDSLDEMNNNNNANKGASNGGANIALAIGLTFGITTLLSAVVAIKYVGKYKKTIVEIQKATDSVAGTNGSSELGSELEII